MYGIDSFDKAQDMHAAAKVDLARVAAEPNGDIAAASGEVAFWLGYARLFGEVERVSALMDEHGVSGAAKQFNLMQLVAEQLSRGADDGWSGRGNDLKRREFDGKREAAQVAIRSIQSAFEALA